jgi:hypothetical protein
MRFKIQNMAYYQYLCERDINLLFIMPKYEPNSRFSDCWSSVGDVTFFHRDGVCYWKKKPVCSFPGTAGQLEHLDVHRRALAAWRGLDHSEQLEWNGFAKVVPSHRPPFNGSGHITGHNLFVSAYHGFALLGDEHVPRPVAWEGFPVVQMEFARVEVIDGTDLRMVFSVKMPECGEPSRYRVVMKLLLSDPGHTRKGEFFRTFVALSNCPSVESEATFLVPGYASLWSVSGPSVSVRCRYFLIDTVTGYRNNFHRISFTMSIL